MLPVGDRQKKLLLLFLLTFSKLIFKQGLCVMRIVTVVFSFSITLSACANHPLPKDVTGYTTFDIVHKVRCEAQRIVLAYLDKSDLLNLQNKILQEDENLKEIEMILSSKLEIQKKIASQIKPKKSELRLLRSQWEKLKNAALQLRGILKANSNQPPSLVERFNVILLRIDQIKLQEMKVEKDLNKVIKEDAELKEYTKAKNAFDKDMSDRNRKRQGNLDYLRLIQFNRTILAAKLTLKVTEENKASSGGVLEWPIQLGKITFGYSAGKEKTRFAQRVVDFQATFEELSNTDQLGCTGFEEYPGSNIARIYPITGRIGVDGFIKQYLAIAVSGRLDRKDVAVLAGGSEAFTDTLTFTTTIKGTAEAGVELKPLSPSLVKAEAKLNAERTDIHEISVRLTPPSGTKSEKPLQVNLTDIPTINLSVNDDLDSYIRISK
jgi:hypothetical protein